MSDTDTGPEAEVAEADEPAATPLLAPGGVCVFPKGRTADEELTAARLQWHMRVEQWSNPLAPDACILRLSEISRV